MSNIVFAPTSQFHNHPIIQFAKDYVWGFTLWVFFPSLEYPFPDNRYKDNIITQLKSRLWDIIPIGEAYRMGNVDCWELWKSSLTNSYLDIDIESIDGSRFLSIALVIPKPPSVCPTDLLFLKRVVAKLIPSKETIYRIYKEIITPYLNKDIEDEVEETNRLMNIQRSKQKKSVLKRLLSVFKGGD